MAAAEVEDNDDDNDYHYINDEDAIKNNTVDYYQRGMVLDQVKFASK